MLLVLAALAAAAFGTAITVNNRRYHGDNAEAATAAGVTTGFDDTHAVTRLNVH